MSTLLHAALVLAVAHILLLGAAAADWRPKAFNNAGGRRLQLVKAHARISTAGWEDGKRFRFLVDQAEDVAASSGHAEAAVMLLRAAFLLCPTCEYEGFQGTHLGAVFAGGKTESAAFLAQTALPALQKHHLDQARSGGPARVLWAGCPPSALRFQYMLGSVRLVTVDPSPNATLFGAPRHIQDTLQRVDRHAQPGAFDLAVVDSLLGQGIDSRRQLQEALRALHDVTAPGGLLLVGWDRFRTSCCQFEPFFEPFSMEGLPERVELPGKEQHAYALFRRSELAIMEEDSELQE